MNDYESCGETENGETESSSDSDKDEALPQQSSVMEIVRQRVRTVHGSDFGDSNELAHLPSFEGTPRRSCKLPLRIAVTALIIISILASSSAMFIYLMKSWSRAHGETISLFRESLGDQGRMLQMQISEHSRAASDRLLLNIEWSVWWYIVQPPSQAALFMFSLLKTIPMQPGWAQWADLVSNAAWTQLRDQWEDKDPTDQRQEVIHGKLAGFAYSLVVDYCTGLYAGASITLDATQSYVFSTRQGIPGQNFQLDVYRVSMQHHVGDGDGQPAQPARQLEKTMAFNPLARPYYVLQKELHRNGSNPKDPDSDAWTGVFNYTIPWNPFEGECGYAKSLPIPSCSGCQGYCGAITSHISLQTIRKALQEQWDRIREDLASPLYGYTLQAERSSVFTIVQRSKAAPKQEGYLLAASNDAELGCAFRYVQHTPISIVASAARAIYLRMNGSWNAEELRSGIGFNMNFSMKELEQGLSVPCESLTSDCFNAATRQINLDDDLQWLVVLVLPAEAFSHAAAAQQKGWEAEIQARQKEVDEAVDTIKSMSAVLLAVSALFGLLAGWCISAFAGYPLRKLKMYMQKLARLELDGLPGLYPGSVTQLSSLSEVFELQIGFVNLARSVETFSRFLPETVVRAILHGDKKSTRIHVRRKNVTIMFSDIRGFTTISEMLSQTDLLTLLYMYLSEMTQIVEAHGGVVSEILGDGLLVLWNTPDELPDHAKAACSAALAQQKALAKLNQTFANLGLPSVAIRIGLHTGDVLAGNIGSNKKMKYGCMGDPVNLASRLEGLAKHYGVATLCSHATRSKLSPEFHCRKLDLVKVKGKEEAVWVYELIHDEMTPERHQKLHLYEEGLKAFHARDFVMAAHMIAALLVQEPEDIAAKELLERIRDAQRFPAGWTPVLEMTEK